MNYRASAIAAWALFAITAVKILLAVSLSPLIAYANNWDFARESACYGVWENYPGGKDKTAFNFERPVNPLRYDGDKRPEWCLKTIDNVFVGLAVEVHDIGDTIDLRWIGLARAAFLLAMTGWLMTLARTPGQSLAISVTFLLAFGDIAYLSFFNTLYAEFSMLAGCFLSAMALMLITRAAVPAKQLLAFSVVALVFFGLSKAQYMPLAVLCAAVFAVVAWVKVRARGIAAIFLALAVAMPVGFSVFNSSSSGIMAAIKTANIMDTLMVAVLPNSRDPSASLAKVGLPKSCEKALGVSWYDPGVANNLPCPEIANTTRVKLIGLFLWEPTAFFNPMRLAIEKVRPSTIHYLGIVETPEVRGGLRFELIDRTSLSRAIDALPVGLYFLIVAASLIAALVGVFRSMRSEGALLIAAGGIVVFYALLSSVFGDGFMEISKHATAIFLGLVIQLGAIGLVIVEQKYANEN